MKARHAVGRLNPGWLCQLPQIPNKSTRLQSHQLGHRRLSYFSDGIVPLCPNGKIPWEGIRRSRSDTTLKKPDLPWGFSVYRCRYKDDKAWGRVLQQLQEAVQESLEEDAPELIPHHQLVINDDATKFDGATSHEIRDHFNVWVEEQLQQVVISPEKLQMAMPERLQRTMPEELYPGPEYSFGARFNFALFVDDICLESLEHMSSPVVKILYKQWGNLAPDERNYQIHPDWHDGTTEMDEEDVGWMYMKTGEYVELYDKCEWSHLSIWHSFYLMPPQMDDQLIESWGDRSELPGFWRIKK